jgi:hypothetical protein
MLPAKILRNSIIFCKTLLSKGDPDSSPSALLATNIVLHSFKCLRLSISSIGVSIPIPKVLQAHHIQQQSPRIGFANPFSQSAQLADEVIAPHTLPHTPLGHQPSRCKSISRPSRSNCCKSAGSNCD